MPQQIFEGFDTGPDGWTITNDIPASLQWEATGGDPDGYLQWTDETFGAPDALYVTDVNSGASNFIGDQSAYYGGILAYHIEDQAGYDASGYDSTGEVVLIGDGQTLAIAVGIAGTSWTDYSVQLTASAGWKVDSLDGSSATEAQMQQVLGDLTTLEIQAEYISGHEVGGLDDVAMIAPGELSASWDTASNGDWNTGNDWSGGIVPNSNMADATIDLAGNYTVTIAGNESETVDTATLDASGAVLDIQGALTLTGSTAELLIEDGTVDLQGRIVGGTIDQTGGTLILDRYATVDGVTIEQTGGALQLDYYVTLDGAAFLLGSPGSRWPYPTATSSTSPAGSACSP
ncbi:MAG: hypothetical protein JO038_07045 [Alphaproteobacteria bacterium]|nr:hypothetical protein [Alphaproteobacteria bacterium]